MSIFKSTFKPEIKAQIEARQSLMSDGRGNIDTISYLNSRSCYIRLTSSVNIIPGSELATALKLQDNELAKKYVLLGGTLYPNPDKLNEYTLRRGIGSGGGAYGDSQLGGGSGPIQNKNIKGTGRDFLGIRPMPGITGLTIKSKSAYGSLREATINFVCFDIRQLEELELLYMRPGYTVLVEWGWTIFPITKGTTTTIQKQLPELYNIIDGNTSKEKIFKDIFAKTLKNQGNYEAMYGYVKNFQWNSRQDGGYDCVVNVISVGEILESLKINYSPSPLNDNNVFPFPITNHKQEIEDSYKQIKLLGILKYIKYEAQPGFLLNSLKLNNISVNYANLKFNVDKTSNIANTNNDNQMVYITLESLVDILNTYIVPTDGKEALIKLSTKDEEGKDLECYSYYRQFSLDPRICYIIPAQGNVFEFNRDFQGLAGTQETISVKPNGISDVDPAWCYFDETKEGDIYKKYNKGRIGKILVNIDLLISILNVSKNDNNIVNLYTFIKETMVQIQKCTGNINNFDIHINENVCKIIDVQYLEDKPEELVKIEVFGTRSTARNYTMQSNIFPEMANMIAISAQVGGGSLGYNTSTYDAFNEGLRDRIIPVKIIPDDKLEQDRYKVEVNTSFIDNTLKMINFIKALNTGTILTKEVDALEIALHDMIIYEINNKKEAKDSRFRAIMPLKLSISIDGIGGIVIGQLFTIPEEYLPAGYKLVNGKLKVGFIVTGIGHAIQNNDWITTIDSQTCILNDILNS